MKTDTLFYQLFQTFPQFFFELIAQPPSEADNYQFASVEVKQLAFRLDGVFLPNRDEKSIYFVEVQFQRDLNFYSRFFSEIFLYLHKTDLKNNWRGVIIYPNRGVDIAATDRYQELVNSGRVLRIYLDELGEMTANSVGLAIIELVIADEEAAIEKGKGLIKRVRDEVPETRISQDLLELIESILIY